VTSQADLEESWARRKVRQADDSQQDPARFAQLTLASRPDVQEVISGAAGKRIRWSQIEADPI